jgi:hypothetical protein
MIVVVGNNEWTDRRVKGLELMSWLVKWRGKQLWEVQKSYVQKGDYSSVARTGNNWPLKGGDRLGDQGLVPFECSEWTGGCLC